MMRATRWTEQAGGVLVALALLCAVAFALWSWSKAATSATQINADSAAREVKDAFQDGVLVGACMTQINNAETAEARQLFTLALEAMRQRGAIRDEAFVKKLMADSSKMPLKK